MANHIPFTLDRTRGSHGTVAGLRQAGCPLSRALADLVQERITASADA